VRWVRNDMKHKAKKPEVACKPCKKLLNTIRHHLYYSPSTGAAGDKCWRRQIGQTANNADSSASGWTTKDMLKPVLRRYISAMFIGSGTEFVRTLRFGGNTK
jgi:hypothetical protein